jgi:hypothetical protein
LNLARNQRKTHDKRQEQTAHGEYGRKLRCYALFYLIQE